MKARFSYEGHRPNRAEILAVLGGDSGRGVGADLEARAQRVLVAAQTRVGVDTGTLLASIHRVRGHSATGPYIDIQAGVPGITTYLGYHHFGTEPHTIRPRRRKALRFIMGGKVVFATKVHHPGTVGTFFLTRALDAAR